MGVEQKLAVLAVSKLGDGLCVAGIDNQYHWIRPTNFFGSWRQFNPHNIFQKNKQVAVALSHVISLRLLHPIPQLNTPHCEDWLYDHTYPTRLIETLNDRRRLRLLERLAEDSLSPLIEKHQRSLCLIKPSSIISADFSHRSVRGKYQPVIAFSFRGENYHYKVTDIYWRALGRRLVKQNHPAKLTGAKLQRLLGYNHIFFTVGLSRKFQGEYWPFVVGVHPIPHVPVPIDYQNP